MLVLSRKKGQRIMIGDVEIKICNISSISGNRQVKLGITAPKNILILREEVKERINRSGHSTLEKRFGSKYGGKKC